MPGYSATGMVDEEPPVVAEVVALLGEVREPRLRVAFGQVADRVEARQHALVVAQAFVARRHRARIDARVGVAEQRGPVAELAGLERDVRVAGVEWSAVRRRTVVHEVHAGVERRAARSARCGLREVPGEAHARGGQPVEVRGPHDRVAGTRERVAAPLVCSHEQHIERARGEASHGGARAVMPGPCHSASGRDRRESVSIARTAASRYCARRTAAVTGIRCPSLNRLLGPSRRLIGGCGEAARSVGLPGSNRPSVRGAPRFGIRRHSDSVASGAWTHCSTDAVAVVTGGGGGIGRGIATRFASEGASVVVAEIDDVARRRHGRGRSKRAGGTAVAEVVDVTTPAGATRAVDARDRGSSAASTCW